MPIYYLIYGQPLEVKNHREGKPNSGVMGRRVVCSPEDLGQKLLEFLTPERPEGILYELPPGVSVKLQIDTKVIMDNGSNKP